MSVNVMIQTMEELMRFANENGVVEVVVRDSNKRYKPFINLAVGNLKEEQRALAQNAVKQIALQNRNMLEKSLTIMNQVAVLQNVNILFSGLNLCATAAGFVIISKQLKGIGNQMDRMIQLLKDSHTVQTDYELNKIISEHADMLDARKTQKYYSEAQMRKLVDQEYSVLTLLIDSYEKNLQSQEDPVILSIFSLASMLSVSIQYFDEIYYENNHQNIRSGSKWHSSHENWTAVFDRMKAKWFIQKLQDHGFFDLTLNSIQTDAYYIGLMDNVKDMKQGIMDHQRIIELLGSLDQMNAYDTILKEDAAQQVERELHENGAIEIEEIQKCYEMYRQTMELPA